MPTLSDAIFAKGLVEALEIKKDAARMRARWRRAIPPKIPAYGRPLETIPRFRDLHGQELTTEYVREVCSLNALCFTPPTFLPPCDLDEEEQTQLEMEAA
jgi:hypothetical protein